MSRLPIRARLTAAFALAMILVLVGAALFVYTQLEADLNETIDEGLAARAGALDASASQSPAGLDAAAAGPAEAEDGFAQVLADDGSVIDAAGGARRQALDPAQLAAAKRGDVVFEDEIEGVAGRTRVLARPAPEGGRATVIAVGQTLEDRDETLSGLLGSFALGGAIAVVVASLIGYALASAGLAPVEAMRRRAAEVSLERDGEPLPLPAARDEIRRLGETLNEMIERLQASFERERRFVADASHELRTPIAVIRAELDAVLAAGDLSTDSRAAVSAAIDECDGLGALAEDMLVLVRVGDGGLPVHRERLDARELLERVRSRFQRRAEESGRGITIAAEPGIVIDADPLRMRQAVSNLVDNALRYGGGEVALAARRLDGEIELCVADQGSGFDAEISQTAFERFTRGDRARTRGGAGLGLAIVREVARAHGAVAEIAEGARGAIVRIRFPASADASQAPFSDAE